MRGDERVGELDGDVEHAIGRERRFSQQLVERPPFKQLADEKRLPIVLARIVHGADVRVRHERRQPRLTPEPFDRPRSRRLVLAEELDGDIPIEPQVARPVDLRRTVTANRLKKLVMREALR